MELNLTRLNALAFIDFTKAVEAPEEPLKDDLSPEDSKTPTETKTGLQGNIEGLGKLQREIDQKQAEKDRALEVYKEHQKNIMLSGQLQTEILKGIKSGESVYNLFLKASKAISLMTGNTAFITQIEADIKSIYGEGLLQPQPLQIELEETEQRLTRLREAQERELSGDSSQRMKNSIKAHEARIAELQELIKKGAENLG